MKLIERPQYLNFLIRNKDLPLIKVITGVRRSGKSTLFTLYKNYLTSPRQHDSELSTLSDLASVCATGYQVHVKPISPTPTACKPTTSV